MNRLTSVAASNILLFLHVVGLPRSRLGNIRAFIHQKILRRPQPKFHTKVTDYAEHRFQKSITNFQLILSGRAPGKAMLEFGTGAMGSDLLLSYLLGYKEIITCDINDHLEIENFLLVVKKARDRIDEIAEKFDLMRDDVAARYDTVSQITSKEGLYADGVIRFLSYEDLPQDPLGEIDLWYSESTLQRLPLKKFETTCSTITKSLSSDAVVFHKLDIADICTQPHYPFFISSAHRFDFLKYPEWLWRVMNNEVYSSQNRLRVPQYLEVFNALGLRLTEARYVRYEGDESHLNEMKLAQPYARLDLSDLSIAHAKLLMTPTGARQPDIKNYVVLDGEDFLGLDW